MTSFGFHTTGDEVVDKFRQQVQGKVIVVTGASEHGLGAATAICLAKGHPAQLILLGRSANKVESVIRTIKAQDASIKAEFVAVELDKPDSVRVAAANISEKISRLDLLINNAGIMAPPYSQNESGIESQLATNHLGHFLLTMLLMPRLKAAGQARIVNLTSDGYKISPFRFEDWNFSNGQKYDRWAGYGQSKTANILFTQHLSRHLSKSQIAAFAVHPGVIRTTSLSNHLDLELFKDIDAVARENTGQPFAVGKDKTIQEGISTTLVAALDPDLLEQSGSMLTDCQVVEVRDYASSSVNASRLWQLSEQLLGQTFSLN